MHAAASDIVVSLDDDSYPMDCGFHRAGAGAVRDEEQHGGGFVSAEDG